MSAIEAGKEEQDDPTPSKGAIRVETHRRGKKGPSLTYRVKFRESGETLIWRLLIGDRLKKKPFEYVRTGLPLSSVDRLRASLKLDEKEVLKVVGISVRTFQRRRREKRPLDAIESDRLYRLAKIEARAVEVFQDEEKAIDWLKTPNRALGDMPIQMLDTEAGTDMVERILARIEYGVYS